MPPARTSGKKPAKQAAKAPAAQLYLVYEIEARRELDGDDEPHVVFTPQPAGAYSAANALAACVKAAKHHGRMAKFAAVQIGMAKLEFDGKPRLYTAQDIAALEAKLLA